MKLDNLGGRSFVNYSLCHVWHTSENGKYCRQGKMMSFGLVTCGSETFFVPVSNRLLEYSSRKDSVQPGY